MTNEVKSAKLIFKQYPKVDTIFFTADGSTFIVEGTAKNHAKTLSDDTIKSFTRAQADAEPDEDDPTPSDEKVKAVKQLIKDGKAAEAVAAAKDLTEDEAKTLSKKDKKFLADNAAADK